MKIPQSKLLRQTLDYKTHPLEKGATHESTERTATFDMAKPVPTSHTARGTVHVTHFDVWTRTVSDGGATVAAARVTVSTTEGHLLHYFSEARASNIDDLPPWITNIIERSTDIKVKA